MTANEMYNDFQTEYDRVASEAAKGWLPNEVSFFINNAQSDIRRHWLNRPDVAERRSYLFPFTKSQILSQSSDQTGVTTDYSVLFEIPSDYPGRSEKEVVTYVNCDFFSPVTPISDDEFFAMNLDISKAPHLEELRRLIMNRPGTDEKLFELFLPKDSNLSIKQYLITYIREPVRIVIDLDEPDNQVNSEYAEDKHVEIVRRAVFYALETAADGRVQSFSSKPLNFYNN